MPKATARPSTGEILSTAFPRTGAAPRPPSPTSELRQCVREAAQEMGVLWFKRFARAVGTDLVSEMTPESIRHILALIG